MDALPPLMLATASAYYEQHDQHQDCYITRVAYDLGSTATKVIVANVNTCTKTIDHVVSENTYVIPFYEDVSKSDELLFSDWMKNYAVALLQNAKSQADLDIVAIPTLPTIPAQRVEQCAIATQAFRIAENSHEMQTALSEKLGFPVSTISQEDEGKLAYLSVLSQWKDSSQKPVVWDMGGGSSQLTFQDEVGEFYVVGTDRASRSFQKEVATKIMGRSEEDSPNPLSKSQIIASANLARQSFDARSLNQYIIQQRIAHDAPIVGIGKVHNQCALQWVQKSKLKSQGGYSQADLMTAIDYLSNKSDDEVQLLAPTIPKNHISNQVTNLILLLAMMQNLNINWVEVLDVNNARGLLLTGCQ